MGIKNIHLILILVSILLALGFGCWTLNHHDIFLSGFSFMVMAGLLVYCVQFIKRMKAL